MANDHSDNRILFTVVGGFLGAGKTTLINRILLEQSEVRFAVLVNDFGSLNIDQDLILNQNGKVMQLANGCICCSLAGGLVDAMVSLMQFRVVIDHILIEASGVSYPGRIMDFARIDAELKPGLTLVLVDAVNLASQINNTRLAETITAQMESADLFLLTKTDISSDQETRFCHDWLSENQADAPILATRADHPAIIEMVLGATINTPQPALPPSLKSVGSEAHSHVGSQLHSAFETITLHANTPIDRAAFTDICRKFSRDILRAKGFVNFVDGPAIWQQTGRLIDVTPNAIPKSDEKEENRRTDLVLISSRALDSVQAALIKLGFQLGKSSIR